MSAHYAGMGLILYYGCRRFATYLYAAERQKYGVLAPAQPAKRCHIFATQTGDFCRSNV
jgi:hypothetical protein